MSTEHLPTRETEGLTFQWRMFMAMAAFIAVIAGVYWFASYEHAGTTMLALSGGLALLCGAWLFVQDRRQPAEAAEVHEEEAEPYLPHASPWPFVIGLGAAICANALILGFAYGIPGAVIVIFGVSGFVAEGRRRA